YDRYKSKIVALCLVLQISTVSANTNEEKKIVENEEIAIKLEQLVKEVVKRNAELIFEKLQSEIVNNKIDYEKGDFEKEFFINVSREHEFSPNSISDAITRNDMQTYKEDLDSMDLGIKGKSVYGTNWSLSLKTFRKGSNLIDNNGASDYEYESGVYIEVEQPIFKGFGEDIGKTKIEIAQLESELSTETYKKKVMDLVGNTIIAYWRLYGAIQINNTWKEIYELVSQQNEDMEQRVRLGNMSKLDLLKMQSVVTTSKVEILSSVDVINEEKSKLLSLLNISVLDNFSNFHPIDNPEIKNISIPNLENAVELSLLNWSELNIINKKMQQEEIRNKFAKNQLLTDLNFVGKLNTTNLESQWNDSISNVFQDDYVSWYAGLQFVAPLGGNKKAKSELKQSVLRMKKIKLEKKALHENLLNALNLKISNLTTTKQRMSELDKSLAIKNEMIEIYKKQLKFGKINVNELIDTYRDRISEKRKWLKGVISIKLSEASLNKAMGTLLDNYSIVISETGNYVKIDDTEGFSFDN
ncbi:TolC family protein, partial [Arcobacter sp. HD9-500m-PIT-SAG03]